MANQKGRYPHAIHSQQSNSQEFNAEIDETSSKVNLSTTLDRINIEGNFTINDLPIGSDIEFAKLQFNVNPNVTLETGELAYNYHDQTVDIKTLYSTLQINQEQVLTIKNGEAEKLFAGTCLRITEYDSINDYYIVKKCDINPIFGATYDYTNALFDGMLTNDMEIGGLSQITIKGLVHDINTTGGTSGYPVYLDENGLFTATEPIYPKKSVVIGVFGKIDTTTGEIFVDANRATQYTTNSLQRQIDNKQVANPGICAQHYITENDIVIDTTALTLTIATIKNGQTISESNPIRFYTDGNGTTKEHNWISPVTFTFLDISGVWYFYFDNNGSYIASQSPFPDFATIATVYRFYWNSTLSGANRLVVESLETHTNSIPAETHSYMHFNTGSIYLTGGDLYHNALTTGAPNADGRNTCIGMSTVTCMDDNLKWTVTNTHPLAGTSYFKQNLGINSNATLNSTNSGIFNIRSNDSNGLLINALTGTNFPFPFNTSTNRPEFITTAGVRTEVTDNNYLVVYLYNLSDRKANNTIKLITAAEQFTSLTNAQAHTIDVLRGQYATMKDQEIRFLYKLTFHIKHSNPSPYSATCKYAVLREVLDIRKATPAASTNAGGSISAANVTTPSQLRLTSPNVEGKLQEVNDRFTDVYRNPGIPAGIGTTTIGNIPTAYDVSGLSLLYSPWNVNDTTMACTGGILNLSTINATTLNGKLVYTANNTNNNTVITFRQSTSQTLRDHTITAAHGTDGTDSDFLSFNVSRSANSTITEVLELRNNATLGATAKVPKLSIGIGATAAALTVGGNAYVTGNVGVGVITPTLTFQATKAVGSTNYLYLDNANTNILLGISTGDTLNIGTNANSPLNIITNGTPKMVVAANGNVGIGTQTPGGVLNVSTTGVAQLWLSDSDAASGSKHRYIQSNDGSLYIGKSNDTFTGLVDHLSILGNGNVGIGTSTPATKLEIATNGTNAVRLTAAGLQSNFSYSEIQMQTSNGTTTSPTLIQADGYIGSWVSRGWDGVSYKDGGYIAMKINGTPALNNMGTDIIFGTNKGAAGASETARFTKNGNLTLNEATEITNNSLLREIVIKSPVNGNSQFRQQTPSGLISTWYSSEFAGNLITYIGNESNHPFCIFTNNAERYRITADGFHIKPLQTAPASATATGTTGTVIYTTTAIFVCTATNTWKKVDLVTF